MTLDPLEALSRLAARRFGSFADAANCVLDLLEGASPDGCVMLAQADWEVGECRVLDVRGGGLARGSVVGLAGTAPGLIDDETLMTIAPGVWVAAPLDASDGSVSGALLATPGDGESPPPYVVQLLLVAARVLAYEWESVSARAELRRLGEAARDREHTDAVTGLPNREALLDALEREWELSRRGTVESYVVVCHLTDLDTILERHGQAAADLALKDVAEVLAGGVRRTDHLARVADESLAAVLVGCKGADGALAFLARMERALDRAAPSRSGTAGLAYGVQALADSDSAGEAIELAEVSARARQHVAPLDPAGEPA